MLTEIQNKLFELSDSAYAAFHSKLIPTAPKESVIGVRKPTLKKYALQIAGSEQAGRFLDTLPHVFYDENVLHAELLNLNKDYNNTIERVENFLPYVDNWAVCDSLNPRVFIKNRDDLITRIPVWISSKDTYTCRFGVDILMSHFLDRDFKDEYLNMPAYVVSDEYYINMAVAWYFATALAKQWDSTIPFIENRLLPQWTHLKSIQKACESFRITEERKIYLRSLK